MSPSLSNSPRLPPGRTPSHRGGRSHLSLGGSGTKPGPCTPKRNRHPQRRRCDTHAPTNTAPQRDPRTRRGVCGAEVWACMRGTASGQAKAPTCFVRASMTPATWSVRSWSVRNRAPGGGFAPSAATSFDIAVSCLLERGVPAVQKSSRRVDFWARGRAAAAAAGRWLELRSGAGKRFANMRERVPSRRALAGVAGAALLALLLVGTSLRGRGGASVELRNWRGRHRVGQASSMTERQYTRRRF